MLDDYYEQPSIPIDIIERCIISAFDTCSSFSFGKMSNVSSRKGASSNNRTVVKGKVAMICNVCKNAGKSERDYTSHFTKMLVSDIVTVVCPTILNNVCSYCKEKGHFKAACAILQEKEKRMNSASVGNDSVRNASASICIPISLKKSKNVTTINVIVSKKAAINKNAFSAAFVDEDSSDEECEEDVKPTEEPSSAVKTRNIKHSWADDNYWDDSEDDM